MPSQPALVVEANLTIGLENYLQPIRLSYSTNFNDSTVRQAVKNAKIELSTKNGVQLELFEAINGTFYLIDTLYPDSSYFLKIETEDGLKYESRVEKAPAPVEIDSIIFYDFEYMSKNAFSFSASDTDNHLFCAIQFKDPPNEKNFYFYKLRTGSVYEGNFQNSRILDEDDFLNGSNLSTDFLWFPIPLREGYNVTVEQITLQESTYNYLIGMQNLANNLGTPFDAPPYTPESNIICLSKPNTQVLGYFSISSSSVKSQICAKSK